MAKDDILYLDVMSPEDAEECLKRYTKKKEDDVCVFKEWTTAFPGKMGLSWKRCWWETGTKEEAEAEASKNCNVVALPLQLYEHIKAIETRVVMAEHCLNSVYVNAANWQYRNREDAVAKTAASEAVLDQILVQTQEWHDVQEKHR